MSLVARVKSWFRASSRRADFEREMHDEMRIHLELYQADLRRRGLSEAEARRRAFADFGSPLARQEECREAVGLRLFDELRGDVTYAVRLLRRSPAFTIVALLSLALGIGANTAIFSLIDSVLVKTLPVQDPQQLFFVDNSGGKSGGSSGPPYPCFERLRDHNRFLSSIAAFSQRQFKLSIDGVPERVRGQFASGSYFDLLGVRAIHGRVLTPADDAEPGRGGPDGPVAVISDAFWTRRFARDPSVLGKNVQVEAQWVTIVGVTPPGFFGLQVGTPVDITLPMMLVEQGLESKQSWWLSVIARLAPDATVEQARADLESLWDTYMTEVGMSPEKRARDYFSGLVLVPAAKGANALRRAYSEPLLIVMGIVGVVLLIGSANVANLLLARATARQNGDRRPARDRRQPRQSDPSAAHRRGRARVAGRSRRLAVRVVGRVVPGCRVGRARSRSGAGAALRSPRPGLYRRRINVHNAALQPCAGTAGNRRRRGETRKRRQINSSESSRWSARRHSSDLVGALAVWRRTVRANPQQPERSRLRIRSRRYSLDAGRGDGAGARGDAEDSSGISRRP